MALTSELQTLTKAFSRLGVDEKALVATQGKSHPDEMQSFRKETPHSFKRVRSAAAATMFRAQSSSSLFGTPSSTPTFGTLSPTPTFGMPSSTPTFRMPSSTPSFFTHSTLAFGTPSTSAFPPMASAAPYSTLRSILKLSSSSSSSKRRRFSSLSLLAALGFRLRSL
ncbi:hypothetical protein TB2_036581 [Malus domestica]